MMRSVLVVDDEPDILELLAVLVGGDPRCASVSVAESLERAVSLAGAACPDTIVLDLMFGHRTCAEILPVLRGSCPGSRIIVFTASERMARAAGVLELGADSIRQKVTVSFEDLVEEALTVA